MNIRKNLFEPLPVGDIHMKGWALNQLKIQAAGISGTLPDFWPDVKDSAWIGGMHEGWERVPYWLDGYIPLAYLLDDDEMKEKAAFYINEIIKRQEEDGWICPTSDRSRYDMWAYILICKVLTVWADLSGDERIEDVLYGALKAFDIALDYNTLYNWGKMRWFEMLIPFIWLYDRKPEDWMLKMLNKLNVQGFDWVKFVNSPDWPYRKPNQKNIHWGYYDHVVNNAMAMKQGVLQYRLTGDESFLDATENMQALYDEYHGMVTGVITGDECLAGTSPVQGTELCAVVEYMYSLENIIGVSGDVAWIDRLERVAFNALPATFSPDMQTHQYDQQVNQVMCVWSEDNNYRTNGPDSNMFGVEPNYGCCTANLSQGWPKFMLSAYMKRPATENEAEGLAVLSYLPCELTTKIKGVPVCISTDTDYPFRDSVRITVSPSMPFEFPLWLRIPEWVDYAEITIGEERIRAPKGEFYKLEGFWDGKTEIDLLLKTSFTLEERPESLYALTKGALVYSIPIEERWEEFKRDDDYHTYPHLDYQVFPESDWNFGFLLNGKLPEIEVRENSTEVSYVFSPETPPVELFVKAKKVSWPIVRNSAARIPDMNRVGESELTVKMIPYGCTNLRMTEIPVFYKKKG